MNQNFSYKMRWLSLLGAVAMLMTHADTSGYFPEHGGAEVWLVKWMTSWAIPAVAWFFFSAGYWFFRGLDETKILPRLKRRVFSLVIPFVIWNALVLLAERGREFAHNKELLGWPAMIRAFSPLSPVNGALWFVGRLMGFMVLAPLLWLLLKNKKVGCAVVAVTLGVSVAVTPNYYSFLYWLPVFCAGGWVAQHYSREMEEYMGNSTERLHWMGALVFFVAGMAILQPVVIAGGRAIYLLRLLSVPALILLAANTKAPPAKGWLVEQMSFYLFCTHWYPDGLIAGKLCSMVPAAMPGMVLGTYLAVSVTVLVLVVGSLLLLHRFAPRLCGVLTGGR